MNKQEYETALKAVKTYEKQTKKKKKRKAKEFYKQMTAYLIGLGSIVIVFSCYMIYITKDLSPLSTLLIGTTADLLGVTKWYCDKSKEEKLDKNRKYYEAHIQKQEESEAGEQ